MKKLLVGLVALLVLVLAFSVAMAANWEVPEGAMVDKGQIDEITKIGDHEVSRYIEIKWPTCTEPGYAVFDCKEDTDTTHQHHVYIKPEGHKWASEVGNPWWGRVVKPATCTEEGYAIDYCTNYWLEDGKFVACDAENPDVKRIIEKTTHSYDDDHYVVEKEATCTKKGVGRKTCIYCNAPLAGKEGEIELDMADHKWTKWNVKYSTCRKYGSATRTCENCDARQVLDAVHPTVLDHGEVVSIDDIIPLYNCGWDEHAESKTFYNRADFEAYISALESNGLSFEVKRDWIENCHRREITYTCTLCHGEEHDDFYVNLIYPATETHIWNEKPEKYELPTVKVDEELIKDQKFNNNGFSLKPTCLLPGFDLYFCKYDADHGTVKEDWQKVHSSMDYDGEDYIWKKVILPATGHEWSDWYEVETFDSEDPNKTVTRFVRTCAVCGDTENKNEKDDAFTGLKKDEDGKWRYYENGVFAEKTEIVEFNGAKFWVIKGLLAQDATGLTICPDGKAWFLEQGRILEVSKTVSYGKDYFIVKNGALDVNANGLFDYDGGKFVFAAGKLLNNVNGLWQNPQDSKWYFLSQGQVQNNFSGVAEYNGHFFVIKGGVFDNGYNGTIEYDGHTFNVVDGELYDEVK